MEDRWGADPSHQLLERWRRPFLVLGAIVLIGGQWKRISSGDPFVIVTGVGAVAFVLSAFLTRMRPEPSQVTDAEAWRTGARRGLLFFGVWTVVAVGWFVVAAVLYSVRPLNLLVPAIPALLLSVQCWTYRHADRLAELEQQRLDP